MQPARNFELHRFSIIAILERMIDMPNKTQSAFITTPVFAPGLQGQLLVAMPDMSDARFSQSIMLICHHDQDGALGLVLNQPTNLSMQSLCEQMDIDNSNPHLSQTPVYLGGPVDTHRGFFLHSDTGERLQAWQNSLPIVTGMGQTLYLTTAAEMLHAIANNHQFSGISWFAFGAEGRARIVAVDAFVDAIE